MPVTAQEILREANMSSRPEFYSGRGAITCDLNYEILTNIAGLIVKYHGEAQKAEFVKMVAAMRRATATDFIVSLYRLERSGWVFETAVDQGGIEVANTGHPSDFGINMATIFGGIAGDNQRDETPEISSRFLRENGVQHERYGRDWSIYEQR